MLLVIHLCVNTDRKPTIIITGSQDDPTTTRSSLHVEILCLLQCVCVFSSHSFWTSSSLDVPAGATQEEGHPGFLIHLLSAVRALIFLARRIQPFLSLVDCEVEFCVLTIYSFSTRWAFSFCFVFLNFLVRKISFAGIELTSQRVRGLRGTSELPGRPVQYSANNII